MLSLLIFPPDALPDASALAALRVGPGAPGTHVRLDATTDLAKALRPGPDGVAVFVSSGADIARLANRLAVHEAVAGLTDGTTRILALLGSAAGMLGLPGLVGASPRLSGVAWDAGALARDLGLDASRPWPVPLVQARGQVVLAARAAGVPAFDTVRDPGTDLTEAVEAARRDGFAGLVVRDAAQSAQVARAGLVAARG